MTDDELRLKLHMYRREQVDRLSDLAAAAFAIAKPGQPPIALMYSGMPGIGMIGNVEEAAGNIGALLVRYDLLSYLAGTKFRGDHVKDPVDIAAENTGQKRIILVEQPDGLSPEASARLGHVLTDSSTEGSPADPQNTLFIVATHDEQRVSPELDAGISVHVRVPMPAL